MHEIGHAFGLEHVISSSEALLMEPFIDTSFDGPQLDDIRGIQGMYGDALEKTFSGQGNDSACHAASLGALGIGGSKTIGAAARGNQVVGATRRTSSASPARPTPTSSHSRSPRPRRSAPPSRRSAASSTKASKAAAHPSPFDANSRNNLALTIFGPNGTTQLAAADNTTAGQIESLAGLALNTPGQYYVRVTGAADNVQLYELALSAAALAITPSADFNDDGRVDGRDFVLWQRTLGATGTNLAADANSDGAVDLSDLAIWRQQFGTSPTVSAINAAPEPPATQLALTLALFLAVVARETGVTRC